MQKHINKVMNYLDKYVNIADLDAKTFTTTIPESVVTNGMINSMIKLMIKLMINYL